MIWMNQRVVSITYRNLKVCQLNLQVLDGPDPPSHRPEVVVVKRRNGGRLDPIDVSCFVPPDPLSSLRKLNHRIIVLWRTIEASKYLLHFKKMFSVLQLTERFSKHGSVDVKLITEKLALVAASTNGM